MSRVPPYFSMNPTNPKDVHHDQTAVPRGCRSPPIIDGSEPTAARSARTAFG